MDYPNLDVLAEVSVALLGFSGLTVVIGHSRFHQLGVVYRMRGLLYASSIAFVGSILPLVGIPLSASVLLLAIAMSFLGVFVGRASFGRQASSIQPSPVLLWTFYPTLLLLTIALWLSPLLMPESNFVVFRFAIGFNLVLSVAYFVRLILSVPIEETSASA